MHREPSVTGRDFHVELPIPYSWRTQFLEEIKGKVSKLNIRVFTSY